MNKVLGILISVVCLLAAFTFSSCSKEAKKYRLWSQKGTVAQKDSSAFYFYERKDYERSAYLLEELLGYYRGNPRYEQIQYTLAYCFYNQRRYGMAASNFGNYMRLFPNEERTEECAFMLAMCYYEEALPWYLDQVPTQKALDQFQLFISSFPLSSRIAEAEKMMVGLRERQAEKAFEKAKLYYKIEDFKAGVKAFEYMIQRYPDSRYREEAQYLWFLASVRLADVSVKDRQRNRYRDAIEIYERFVDRYPSSVWLRDAEKTYAKAKEALGRIQGESR